jgi:CDP-paratose 2-epimerase
VEVASSSQTKICSEIKLGVGIMVAFVTGSAGLVGSESVRFLAGKGMEVVGIDNDMRAFFFGADASTRWSKDGLLKEFGRYEHHDIDIRDESALEPLFARYGADIDLVVHTAAQPSHDWAARDPFTDFSVNANGTLNLLEFTRKNCPSAVFIFTSTNKVYGDRPNELPLVEMENRWEVAGDHLWHGIDETMSIDRCLHSVFGASKVAADILVQEYGRYFGIKTACFRGGCLTGPAHSGAPLHGFLAYLMRCVVEGRQYNIHGYKGKQVRDNIHSADLVSAFWAFFQEPQAGAVYNMGGGRDASCSIIEAIELCQEIASRPLDWTYQDANRVGDHIWWISDTRKFERQYPRWRREIDLKATLQEIHDGLLERARLPS